MENYKIKPVNAGNTFPGVRINLPNRDNFSLLGAKIIMQVRQKPGQTLITTLSNAEGNGKIAIVGEYSFEIVPHTVTMKPDTYMYDILIIFADGRRKTYVGGSWTINKVITVVSSQTINY